MRAAYDRIGLFIKATHPYGFRCGEWGRILGIERNGPNGHPCYMVGFDDEVCDLWVIDDPSDHYEFSPVVPAWGGEGAAT